MSDNEPIPAVSDGKDLASGRFTAGNRCAKETRPRERPPRSALSYSGASRPPILGQSWRRWWNVLRPASRGLASCACNTCAAIRQTWNCMSGS